MKVLWLCNIILPVIGKKLGIKVPPYGGWISGMANSLSKKSEIELTVCIGLSNTERIEGIVDGIKYVSYNECSDNVLEFRQIISHIKPDVIHIWGTENSHSYDMVRAAKQENMIDKVVVNIQGLVSIYSEYHYFHGLPYKVSHSNRLVELKYGHRICDDHEEMAQGGELEKKTLALAKHFVTKTDWDTACVIRINPTANCYFCPPNLRQSFYDNTWDYEKCEKHTIFVSQSNYCIKGFHMVLRAMPEILQRFPNTKVYVTGDSPVTAYKNAHDRVRQRSYPQYIAKLIIQNNLEDHIVYTGLLDEEKMCDRFIKSNVFVSPSSIENESNSVGEAMLLGMPVVSSFVGGISNYMVHNSEGFFYQADAPYMLAYYVCKVFEDKEKAIQIGKMARMHALRSFDRDKNFNTMMEIYKTISES